MGERTEIAARALQGLLSAGPNQLTDYYGYKPSELASTAVQMADALIRELDKPRPVKEEPTGDQPGVSGGKYS